MVASGGLAALASLISMTRALAVPTCWQPARSGTRCDAAVSGRGPGASRLLAGLPADVVRREGAGPCDIAVGGEHCQRDALDAHRDAILGGKTRDGQWGSEGAPNRVICRAE